MCYLERVLNPGGLYGKKGIKQAFDAEGILNPGETCFIIERPGECWHRFNYSLKTGESERET